MMNQKALIFFALFISSCCLVTTTSACPFYKTNWTVYITNQVPDNIVVHIKSTDHDLGNYTIAPTHVHSLTFCQKVVGTHFHGYFWWGSKYQSLALMDAEIIKKCRKRFAGNEYCYWLVRTDGFYLSASNQPFPYGWVKKKAWP
ncbi:putative plant self-incompatibility S1 [Helianthus anomalus]